jgi:hypothetical protein
MASMASGEGPPPQQSGTQDGPGEVAGLGKKAVAGVDGVGTGATRGIQDQVVAQVGLGR